MNISEWEAGMVLAATVLGVWFGCRVWYLRRIRLLRHQMFKLDAAQQTATRMSAQARKQIEELQHLVAEYRRRLTAIELGRRARTPANPAASAEAPEPLPSAPVSATTLRLPPGGWADTQPM